MRRQAFLAFAVLVSGTAFSGAGSARAGLILCAQYDWQQGASDVSGSPIRHDGVLDPSASIADGKLTVNHWDGMYIGSLPELTGATSVLLRFEDVTFTQHSDPESGATSNFTVLSGDGMTWWAAVDFDLLPSGAATTISFDLGGFDYGPLVEAVVAAEVVDDFDSIEYRFDGTAPIDQRLAVRWNDGPWVTGGEGGVAVDVFPRSDNVRVNNGAAADWDPMWGSFGAISFYSNQVPEPAAGSLLMVASITWMLRAAQVGRKNGVPSRRPRTMVYVLGIR